MTVTEVVGWLLAGLAWLALTVRRVGWARLRRVAAWPGEWTMAALASAVPAHHRRRVAVYARLAWTTYRCWRHGIR
jgi:hypothetical protein